MLLAEVDAQEIKLPVVSVSKGGNWSHRMCREICRPGDDELGGSMGWRSRNYQKELLMVLHRC